MTRLDPSKNYFDGPVSIPRFSEPDAEGMRTLLGYRGQRRAARITA